MIGTALSCSLFSAFGLTHLAVLFSSLGRDVALLAQLQHHLWRLSTGKPAQIQFEQLEKIEAETTLEFGMVSMMLPENDTPPICFALKQSLIDMKGLRKLDHPFGDDLRSNSRV